MKPLVPWIEKVGQEDPQYWDRETRNFRVYQELFRGHLENLKTLYNQSEGLHIWQLIYGCELQADGSKRGFYQFGYEGRTLITFNMETLTWVAPDPLAQFSQKKWDAIPELNQRMKAYLGEVCIEWLERYLSYGKETLLRTDLEHFLDAAGVEGEVVEDFRIPSSFPSTFQAQEGLRVNCNVSAETPIVTMTSRLEAEDGMETHICRVDGFYPKEIDASWKRDGEVWEEETIHGFLAPNVDGTYHYWLSIRIDPKERSRYQCHVEHDGLQEPLALALKEPTNSESNLGLIIGCILGGGLAGKDVKMTTMQHQVSELPSFYVISNLEQGPGTPSVETGALTKDPEFRPGRHHGRGGSLSGFNVSTLTMKPDTELTELHVG
ncbi:putative MHC class I antigen protein [Naja naja]|nr:putative MHC class I antigen protein [Naja naja]